MGLKLKGEKMSLSQTIVEKLFSIGVREVISCPGGRSAALLNAFLDHGGFEIESIYDERTAGFYALGKSLAHPRPVVVLTTSGSAVAGLYPAVLEGQFQQGGSLILLTADRPEQFRFTGAPQTINQIDFFGANGVRTLNVESADEVELTGRVTHLNVSLEDPNPLDQKTVGFELGDLMVLGSLMQNEKSQVTKVLGAYHGYIVLEALSNVKAEDFPYAKVINYPDLFFAKNSLGLFKRIYRLGGVPVSKFWRSTESLDVFYWDAYAFPGTPKAQALSLEHIRDQITMVPARNEKFEDRLEVFDSLIEEVLLEQVDSEVSQLKKLSDLIPEGSRVFLGNSLPIREWEYCKPDRFENIGQRGVNGIDGSLAFFLGQLSKERENWIVLGDLTTLYNTNDFQILKKIKGYKVRIVVVNNNGGKIFSRIFKRHTEQFVNSQNCSFKKLAELWGLGHVEAFSEVLLPMKAVIELKPSEASSDKLWDEWKVIEF